jgi:maltose-binding protein MalE
MDNTFTGRVIAVMDERSGISKNGSNWREREYVIKETADKYPKTICVKVKGENIGKFNIQLGESITAHINIDAHDWQGKWYNEVIAWSVERG